MVRTKESVARVTVQLHLALLLGLIGGVASPVIAQVAPAAGPAASADAPAPGRLPTFEVATIKPVDTSQAEVAVGVDIDPSGRVKLNGLSLKSMISVAFDLRFWQISGGDPWVEKNAYNVVAEPPEAMRAGHPDTRHGLFTIESPQLRQMTQALLIDRFRLRFHRERKTGNIYLLETSGKKLLLRPSAFAKGHPEAPVDTFGSIGWAEAWDIDDASMTQLAKFASDFIVHRPVLDRTGLAGAFDYRGPHEDPSSSFADQTDSFFRTLNDVGLRLVPAKGPVETLVIDHAEPPSPN